MTEYVTMEDLHSVLNKDVIPIEVCQRWGVLPEIVYCNDSIYFTGCIKTRQIHILDYGKNVSPEELLSQLDTLVGHEDVIEDEKPDKEDLLITKVIHDIFIPLPYAVKINDREKVRTTLKLIKGIKRHSTRDGVGKQPFFDRAINEIFSINDINHETYDSLIFHLDQEYHEPVSQEPEKAHA